MTTKMNIALTLGSVVFLFGCAPQHKTIYSWEKYQPTIYDYYQKDKKGPEEQIASLKETLEKAQSKDMLVPPGLHAQLGLLYAETGNINDSLAEFTAEKTLFPESSVFMNFLANRQKGEMK